MNPVLPLLAPVMRTVVGSEDIVEVQLLTGVASERYCLNKSWRNTIMRVEHVFLKGEGRADGHPVRHPQLPTWAYVLCLFHGQASQRPFMQATAGLCVGQCYTQVHGRWASSLLSPHWAPRSRIMFAFSPPRNSCPSRPHLTTCVPQTPGSFFRRAICTLMYHRMHTQVPTVYR